MEKLGDVLGRSLSPGTIIPDQKTSEVDDREVLRKSLNISSWDNTFDNFKPVKGSEKSLSAFKELAQGSGWRMLLCYGGVGNGKTHLCEALVIELYSQGLFCRVMTMAKMMRTLKSTMNQDSVFSYDTVLENWCRSPRLVIDDVGMGGSGSDWEFGQLEEIVVSRYRDRLLTVLTTNRDIKDLPERIVSRFRDTEIGRVVLNCADDYRPNKA